MCSSVKEKVHLQGLSQLSRGGKKNKGLEQETEHALDWGKGGSKQKGKEPCKCYVFSLITWKNSFSLLFEYNQKHQKSHQYGNHASLKGMERKFSEIPKSTD